MITKEYFEIHKNDLIKKWSPTIQSYMNGLEHIKEIKEHLTYIAEKTFLEINMEFDQQLIGISPHQRSYNIPTINTHNGTFTSRIQPQKEYLEGKIREVLQKESDKIISALKKDCFKVVDKVYNPHYNKIGYKLENGDIVFTDDKLERITVDYTKIMRKISINTVIGDD